MVKKKKFYLKLKYSMCNNGIFIKPELDDMFLFIDREKFKKS